LHRRYRRVRRLGCFHRYPRSHSRRSPRPPSSTQLHALRNFQQSAGLRIPRQFSPRSSNAVAVPSPSPRRIALSSRHLASLTSNATMSARVRPALSRWRRVLAGTADSRRFRFATWAPSRSCTPTPRIPACVRPLRAALGYAGRCRVRALGFRASEPRRRFQR
jgi:hypothetical protein